MLKLKFIHLGKRGPWIPAEMPCEYILCDNTLSPDDAYLCHWAEESLVEVTASGLFGTKLLP